MGKFPPQAVQTVVTIQAGGAEGTNMLHGKCRVRPAMTGGAYFDIKDGHIGGMTIGAFERRIFSREAVRVQEVSRSLMRIPPSVQFGKQCL